MPLIRNRCDNPDFMEFLFSVISKYSSERRRSFVASFLEHNNGGFEDFKRLLLEPDSWTSHGSWVPVFQERIDFFESLLPLLNTTELLGHKQYIERRIQGYRKEIEQEKKRDFIGD